VQQADQFIVQAPHYLQLAQDHSSLVGRLNARFHLQQRLTDTINGSAGSAFSGVVKAGTVVFGALSNLGVVACANRLLPGGHAAHPRHLVPAGAALATTASDPHRR
jgi:hypothetical protein